jgi:hypothetical protein
MEANTNVLFRRLHRPSEGRIRRTSGGSLDLDDDVTVNSAPFPVALLSRRYFSNFRFKKFLSSSGFSQLDGDTRVNSIAREALHKDVKSSSESISSSSTKLNSHLVGTFFMIIIVRLISRF